MKRMHIYRSWHFHAESIRSQRLDTSMMRLWWRSPDDDSDSLTALDESSRPLLPAQNIRTIHFALLLSIGLHCTAIAGYCYAAALKASAEPAGYCDIFYRGVVWSSVCVSVTPVHRSKSVKVYFHYGGAARSDRYKNDDTVSIFCLLFERQ